MCVYVCVCVIFHTVPSGPPCQQWPLPNQRRCKYPASFGPITTAHTVTYRSEWAPFRHPVRIAVTLRGRLWLAIWRASPRPPTLLNRYKSALTLPRPLLASFLKKNYNESHFPTASVSPCSDPLSSLTAFTPMSCWLDRAFWAKAHSKYLSADFTVCDSTLKLLKKTNTFLVIWIHYLKFRTT